MKIKKYQKNILTQVWKRKKPNYLLELKSAQWYRKMDQPSELKANFSHKNTTNGSSH